MDSKTENSHKDRKFRQHFRNQIIGKVIYPELQTKFCGGCTTEDHKPSPHIKQQSYKFRQQHNSGLENTFSDRPKNVSAAVSGGDADGMLNRPICSTHHIEYYCNSHNNDNFPIKHTQSSSEALASAAIGVKARLQDCRGDYNYVLGSDSTITCRDMNSEGSAKSQKSSQTVTSRKSSRDMKEFVKSQCKLHEEIGETLKEMRNTEGLCIHDVCGVQEEASHSLSATLDRCKRCSDRLNSHPSRKDVPTEIRNGHRLDCSNTNTLTISLDDVINSKVINPIIHKLHRMHLNNLKEEMSLMEDLEQLPNKVNEVFKSIVYKQNG